jgi:outer membrane protease
MSQTPSGEVKVDKSGTMNSSKSSIGSFKANGAYLDLGLRMGYMSGYNSFDLNHQTSELKYPFDVYLGGITAGLGKDKVSLNLEFWTSLFNGPNRGWNMTDKDWDDDGDLTSYTKSKSEMDALIGDLNLRYNFLDNFSYGEEKIQENKKVCVRLGGLLGYRYQRYRYKMRGLYQIADSELTEDIGDNVTVLGYQVKYYLPYLGIATEIGNDKFGISLSGKYGISPSANDLDQHILRGLSTRADYNKHPNVFMGNFSMYWNFLRNWQANTGVDVALIRIDGKLHEENYDPEWNLDQDIDTRQFIYWVGFSRRF